MAITRLFPGSRMETNWLVFTGAPSSGKTTIISLLDSLRSLKLANLDKPRAEFNLNLEDEFLQQYKNKCLQRGMHLEDYYTHINNCLNIFDQLVGQAFGVSDECFRHYLESVRTRFLKEFWEEMNIDNLPDDIKKEKEASARAQAEAATQDYIQTERSHYEALFAYRTRELGLVRSQLVLMDRALPDSLAYFQLRDFNLETAKHAVKAHFQIRYKSVFVFEKLPFELDGDRFETEEQRDILHQAYINQYFGLGYNVITIPRGSEIPHESIEQRLAIIVNYMNQYQPLPQLEEAQGNIAEQLFRAA